MSKPTPGPWRWELNEKHRSVQLCGGDPRGGFGKFDETVMDFVRWGMSGACPRFIDRRTPITRLSRADEFGVVMEGREHHSNWFKLIDHPDARLLAAAPDLSDFASHTQWEVIMGALEKWTKDGGSQLVALGIIGQGLLILDEARRAALARATTPDDPHERGEG